MYIGGEMAEIILAVGDSAVRKEIKEFCCSEGMNYGVRVVSQYGCREEEFFFERLSDELENHPQRILILGADLGGIDYVNVAEKLKEKGFEENVIVISWHFSSLQRKLLGQAGVGYCFTMPLELDVLFKRIRQWKNMRDGLLLGDGQESGEAALRAKTTRLLHDIGVPANLCGHEYLRDAILMTAGKGEIYGKMTKTVYPAISQRYSKSPASIEKAIRTALDIAWMRGKVDLLNDIFGFTVNIQKGKPTNSEFIALLGDYVLSCG